VAVDFESDQVTLDEIRTQIEDTGYEVV